MPKAARKSSGDEGDDIPFHSTINEEEVKEYSSSLDNIVIKLGIDIKEEVKDTMKGAIIEYKEVMTKMVPRMDTAGPDAMWRAIKDKVGLCICPPTEEKERTLECLIPDQEIPLVAQVLEKLDDADELTKEDRGLIRELFESLEVAHSELASACSMLSCLSGTLKPRQLMGVLQESTRPLIQVKTTSAFIEPDVPGKTTELPEDPEERVELLMMPNPTARSLKDKKINSLTRLLAAMWAYRVSNVFGKGTTQQKYRKYTVCGPNSWQPASQGGNIWGVPIGKGGYPDPMRDPPHQRNHPDLPDKHKFKSHHLADKTSAR